MKKLSYSGFRPNEAFYRYVKTVKVAGVIANRDHVFYFFEPRSRLKLVRESKNSDNKNAICIESDFLCGEKIGYIPPEDVEHFAPKMDKGVLYVGWIKSLNKRFDKILVDVYERLRLSISEISCLQYSEWEDSETNIFAKISFRDRSFFYKKQRKDAFLQVSVHFTNEQWKDFVIPTLQSCNFMAWEDKYNTPRLLDGFQHWMLQIQIGEKDIREIYGVKDFPEEWDIFYKFLFDCRHLDNAEYRILPIIEYQIF